MQSYDIERLRDLTTFAPLFFKIRLKSGRAIPFTLNQAQQYLHRRLETQLAENKRVRAVILKGRQQGCSTYIQARYFHKVITNQGLKAFILTHEQDATKNLFEMTKYYYENLPKGLCPEAERSSAKELKISRYDGSYSVGTAGNKGVGRSQTVQLFHGSEVAFWQNAEEHARGVLQAVSDDHGTEIILESTANGMGNYFHGMWLQAMSGASEFQAIFLPWYWQPEYKRFDTGFKPDEDEQLLLDAYSHDGLTAEHMAWRRSKIMSMSKDAGAGSELFKSEYPMNAEEAFRNAIDNVFITSSYVLKARMNDVDSEANLIVGVDPAIANSDRTAIIRRKGRVAYNLDAFRNSNTMETVGRIRHIIDTERPTKIFIDCIGIGAGIVDRLREMGFTQVVGVNVARSANIKDKFKNLRAELWSDMRDWLCQELPVQIPDSDELHGELCSLGYKYNSNGQLQIESKDDLRARGMPSPDMADALALTFYNGQYASESAYTPVLVPKHHQGMFY
jgi:hypothetical protein